MKILRLLNRYFYFFILYFFLGLTSLAEDQPTDIWNTQESVSPPSENRSLELNKNDLPAKENEMSIYKMQSQRNSSSIELNMTPKTNDLKIIGLYDPSDYDLDINMWSNSDGDQLKNIFSKLNKLKLSNDAKEILNISLLINAHSPKKNITNKEFLKFKSNWLIRNSDLDLIENYLIENQIINSHPKLTKYFLDEHLSVGNINKACEMFEKNSEVINDDYINKYLIYCLIKNDRIEEAKLIYDLKKELGFKDKYFIQL